MANKLSGAYTKHSTGVEYRYEATWEESGGGGTWNSTVSTADGNVVASPGGTFLSTHSLSHATYVRVLVEEFLKNRVE
jgi:hypothetical protein